MESTDMSQGEIVQPGVGLNEIIGREIREFVRTSPLNRLESFDNEPIFEAPLVGFADGDDPLFVEYKTIVHRDHFTPREILEKHLSEASGTGPVFWPSVGVISYVLPVNCKTIAVNAREKEGPSLRWNHTRWKGQEFNDKLSRHLVSFLDGKGIRAVAPSLTPGFKIMRGSDGIASNWSHRHMAYAAGLGTFSLNEGFITPKGMAMRCGSVVVGAKLEPTPRPYGGPFANCLFRAGYKCGACIKRCPGGALSEKGHDKLKCLSILFEEQKPWLQGAHGPGYIGEYAGCGLCQTGVPCESCIPAREHGK